MSATKRIRTSRRRSRRVASALVGGVLGLGVLPVVASAATPAEAGTSASSTTSAATPPMGFNDWNAFKCNVSASLIEQTAQAMVADGMKAAGYRYVNIDDCWLSSTRDANGNLVPDPTKFPGGITPVADYVHSLGLKLGIYEDAGTLTCAGYPGSYGHEQQDAATLASWGVDYVKYDQCNIPFGNYPGMTHAQIDQMLYTKFATALHAANPNIVFSACTGVDTTSYPWTWAPAISNLWRTTPDISDNFASMLSIVNQNAPLAQYAGPGHWNDPDMLEIGNGGMSTTEYQSEFSLWSIMAAPLIAGTPLTAASSQTLAIYENQDVIAVDQDALGKQGTLVSNQNGAMVFAKPLANGDVAIVLFNASGAGQTISTTASATGVPTAKAYQLSDLWSKQTTYSGGVIQAFVPAHGVAMYRVSPSKQDATVVKNPATALGVSPASQSVAASSTEQVQVSFTNDGLVPVRLRDVELSLPAGWTLVDGSQAATEVAPGQTVTTTFTVSVPASTVPMTSSTLTAQASYTTGGVDHTQSSSLSQVVIVPVAAPLATTSQSADPALFGMSGTSAAISAAGTGITPPITTSRGTSAASDSYASIYRPGGMSVGTTIQARVDNVPSGRGGAAGLVVRNSMTGSGTSPAGVALELNAKSQIVLAWNATGGSTVDTQQVATGTFTAPEWLRLTRTGTTTYIAQYSSDGATWTTLGTATLAPSAAAATQDDGLFSASGSAGVPVQVNFEGVQI